MRFVRDFISASPFLVAHFNAPPASRPVAKSKGDSLRLVSATAAPAMVYRAGDPAGAPRSRAVPFLRARRSSGGACRCFGVRAVADSAMVTRRDGSVRSVGVEREVARALVAPRGRDFAVPDAAFDGAGVLFSGRARAKPREIKSALSDAGASFAPRPSSGPHAGSINYVPPRTGRRNRPSRNSELMNVPTRAESRLPHIAPYTP